MAVIWIVEDEQEYQTLLSFVLDREGYSVRSFWDGASVLAALKENRPDLVVLDIGLPSEDGFAVCQALRADPSLEPIPVVVTSARQGLAARCRMFDLGADDFLQKPFDTLELLVRVKNRSRRASTTGRMETTDSRA